MNSFPGAILKTYFGKRETGYFCCKVFAGGFWVLVVLIGFLILLGIEFLLMEFCCILFWGMTGGES